MYFKRLYLVLCTIVNTTFPYRNDYWSNYGRVINSFQIPYNSNYYQLYTNEIPRRQIPKARIDLYYESLCPSCMSFYPNAFVEAVQALQPYLDVNTYPYGNAQTNIGPNGQIDFTCQHGPPECYGNKLHACVLHFYSGNITAATAYNACMMRGTDNGGGSNDVGADKCGYLLGLDSNKIKTCAKTTLGTQLLYNIGIASKQAGFKYVPYILINGVETTDDNFKTDLCNALRNQPAYCQGMV